MANSRISALPSASTPLAGTELVPIVQGGITEQVSVANLTAGRAVSALSLSTTQGITGGSGFQISGFSAYRASGASTSSPGDASMYFNSATGQTLQARAGSSYDWSLINPGNANYIARVPTGTLNFELAGGNLIMSTSGKGIDFSATSGTGTSELLADYEEGTFTVTFTMGSGTVTTNTSNNTASYTKIGRYVFVSGNIEINAASTPSGTMSFQLPFTIASTTQNSERFAGTCLIAGFTLGNGAGMVTADSGTTAYIKDYTNSNPTPDGGCEVYFGFGFIAA